MSKASEWARTIDDPMPTATIRDELYFDAQGAVALVTSWPDHDARLTILRQGDYSHATLSSAEALAFARWIVATFGEGR